MGFCQVKVTLLHKIFVAKNIFLFLTESYVAKTGKMRL
jgi:hypothetical protein